MCNWSGVNKGGEHTLRHWQQEIQGTKQGLPRAQRAPTHPPVLLVYPGSKDSSILLRHEHTQVIAWPLGLSVSPPKATRLFKSRQVLCL